MPAAARGCQTTRESDVQGNGAPREGRTRQANLPRRISHGLIRLVLNVFQHRGQVGVEVGPGGSTSGGSAAHGPASLLPEHGAGVFAAAARTSRLFYGDTWCSRSSCRPERAGPAPPEARLAGIRALNDVCGSTRIPGAPSPGVTAANAAGPGSEEGPAGGHIRRFRQRGDGTAREEPGGRSDGSSRPPLAVRPSRCCEGNGTPDRETWQSRLDLGSLPACLLRAPRRATHTSTASTAGASSAWASRGIERPTSVCRPRPPFTL